MFKYLSETNIQLPNLGKQLSGYVSTLSTSIEIGDFIYLLPFLRPVKSDHFQTLPKLHFAVCSKAGQYWWFQILTFLWPISPKDFRHNKVDVLSEPTYLMSLLVSVLSDFGETRKLISLLFSVLSDQKISERQEISCVCCFVSAPAPSCHIKPSSPFQLPTTSNENYFSVWILLNLTFWVLLKRYKICQQSPPENYEW